MKKDIKILSIKIEKREEKLNSIFGVMTPLLAVLLSMLIGGIVISIVGVDPIYAYQHLLYGAFGNVNNIAETLTKTTPIMIVGIGLSISFRSNLTNIGGEGQMIMGAVFSLVTGFLLAGYSNYIAIPLCILAGFLGGALFGAVPGLLKAKFGTSEIINTIMMNYIVYNILSYLLDGPLKEPNNYYPQSAALSENLWFPKIIQGTRLHMGFIIAVILIIAYYILIFRLPLGFRIRAVGQSQKASKYAGIKVKRNIIVAMLLSGGLAGIAGASEIFGIHHRLYNGFTTGYGFDAIAVALLGRLHPIGVLFAALFFGALRVGANSMQNAVQIPVAVVYIIQGISVLFILTDDLMRSYIVKKVKKRKSKLNVKKVMEG